MLQQESTSMRKLRTTGPLYTSFFGCIHCISPIYYTGFCCKSVSEFLHISMLVVRVKLSQFAIMEALCGQIQFFSFLNYAGAIGKTWRAYWMSSVFGETYFCPLFIGPLISDAHAAWPAYWISSRMVCISIVYLCTWFLARILYFCP